MRKRFSIFALLTAAAIFFFPAVNLSAAPFNPNYILSDDELQDANSLGRGEISLFLRAKGSFLADYITKDTAGELRRASEIIYRAAREYSINPKYLLVKLQKEQSLVTDAEPAQRQLDWAAGYGVCDSCSTSDPALQKHKGFGVQVDSAAGIMRWYYDHVGEEGWIKKPNADYDIDGTTVRPANYATAFLYTYTPHLEGNQNFAGLWNEWFKQSYPNGTLIKSAGRPTVYLIQDGKKRPFKSMAALVSRYNQKLIVTAPAEHVASYPEGKPIDFPNYSVFRAGENYYLLDDESLRPFAYAGLVRQFGYHPDEIIVIGTNDVYEFATGTMITADSLYPAGRLVRIEGGGIYFTKDGIYYSVPEALIAKARWPSLAVERGQAEEFSQMQSGGLLAFPDGALIGNKTTGQVFAIDRGARRHITSEKVFLGLGYLWSNVVWVDEPVLALHPLGEPVYLSESRPESSFKAPADGPAVFPETGKMIATPATGTIFAGTKTFDTGINTYLVAKYTAGQSAEILAGKNIDAPRPLASLTKVMTAYRLFAEGIDLSGITTFAAAAHTAPYHHLFKIADGEQIRNRDLLYSMLVSSLNTPSRMLVSSVTDSESNFIARATQQARDWGLTKTYFTDTSGYSLGNQSTASEFLTIFIKTIENNTLRDYLGTKKYEYTEITDLNGSPRHADDHSNKLALAADLPYTIHASKTGYLYESGYNLAMFVSRPRDGAQFIVITLGNPDYDARFSETDRLARWTLDNF